MYVVYVFEYLIVLLICYMIQLERIQNFEFGLQNKFQVKFIFDNVQWYFVDDYMVENELIEYLDNINLIIEKVYCNQDKEVKFVDDGGIEYVINFNNMMEYFIVDKIDIIIVIRRVKIKGFYDYYYCYYYVFVIKYYDY